MPPRVWTSVLLLGAFIAPCSVSADERLVAEAFSKAAVYIFNGDFLHEPPEDTFTPKELAILGAHVAALSPMIEASMNGPSVGGALLAAQFGLDKQVPLLRWQLLQPGRRYGWEGSDPGVEENSLMDHQFVYHRHYVHAIEAITVQPIHQAVRLTPQEKKELLQYLNHPEGEHYYWAKWLARKLRVVDLTLAPMSERLQAESKQWPRTVEAAAALMLSFMSAEDKKRVRETPRERLITLHHGWGGYIRNNFGLWHGNKPLLEDSKVAHPDDASMVIITAVWTRLQSK